MSRQDIDRSIGESLILRWAEPPPVSFGPGVSASKAMADAIVEELKSRPGEWAVVSEGEYHSSGREKWVRRGCEVAIRVRRDRGFKEYDVYARWPMSEGADD